MSVFNSSTSIEALIIPATRTIRNSSTSFEVLSVPEPSARISELSFEVLYILENYSILHLSQETLEVLIHNAGQLRRIYGPAAQAV